MIEQVFNKTRSIIVENANNEIETEAITLETSLNSLGINSIIFIKILIAVETEFDIEFDSEDLNIDDNKFLTVKSFTEYIIQLKEIQN